MLDLTNLTKRYYTLKLIDAQGNTQKLSVKPAKLKIITKMTDAIKGIDSENPDLDPIVEILAKMLSSNKEGITITAEDLGELPLDSLMVLINDYFDWLQNTKKN